MNVRIKIVRSSFLFLFAVFSVNIAISQTTTGYYLPLNWGEIKDLGAANTAAGTCAAPDGSMNSIGAPPGSYAALQSGGYCNPNNYGKNGTVCWSFTPTQNSVSINSGYSQSGCSGMSFGPFTLYTCAPACTNMGAGLNFTVIPGQCYTWCLSWSGTGPPSCTVNDWCPYYQQYTILPIELSYFAGSNQGDVNVLLWTTMSEKENGYFDIEHSTDAVSWKSIGQVKGSGSSTSTVKYKFEHQDFSNTLNYYRLKQNDYDGTYKYYGTIMINNNPEAAKKIIKITNYLGQEVQKDYNGIIYVFFEDGSVSKQYSIE